MSYNEKNWEPKTQMPVEISIKFNVFSTFFKRWTLIKINFDLEFLWNLEFRYSSLCTICQYNGIVYGLC